MDCLECMKIIPILIIRFIVWFFPYCFKHSPPRHLNLDVQLQMTHSRQGGWYSGYYRHSVSVRDSFYVLLGLRLRKRGFKELILFVERLAEDINSKGQVPGRYEYSWFTGETPCYTSGCKNIPEVDANIYFLIMAGWLYEHKPKMIKQLYLNFQRAYHWLNVYHCQDTLYEPLDASWENTLNHKGHLLLTNIIFIHAIRSMELIAMVNKDKKFQDKCVEKHGTYIAKWQPELYRTQEVLPRILGVYWNMVPASFLMSFNQSLPAPHIPLRTMGPIKTKKTFHSRIRGRSDLHDTVLWPFLGFLWISILAERMKKDVAKGWWASYTEFHKPKILYDIYSSENKEPISRAFLKSTPTHSVTISMYMSARHLINQLPV